jgi:hypothetical protein
MKNDHMIITTCHFRRSSVFFIAPISRVEYFQVLKNK